MQSQERQFFNAIFYLVFDRSNVSKGMPKAFVWPFQDQRFFTVESIAFVAVL